MPRRTRQSLDDFIAELGRLTPNDLRRVGMFPAEGWNRAALVRAVKGLGRANPELRTIEDLDYQHICTWINAMMEAMIPRLTIRARIRHLSGACAWAIDRGRLDRDPTRARRSWMPNGYRGKTKDHRDDPPPLRVIG